MGVGFEYGFAPNWSFGVEYDHLFMGDANNSFTGSRGSCRILSTTGSARTWTWSPCASTTASAVMAARSREILTSRYFDFSSKLGRQKCRPFCWRLHV